MIELVISMFIWGCMNRFYGLVTKGEKILLTTDRRRKHLPTSDKKMNWDLPTTDNWQSNEILTDMWTPSPPPFLSIFVRFSLSWDYQLQTVNCSFTSPEPQWEITGWSSYFTFNTLKGWGMGAIVSQAQHKWCFNWDSKLTTKWIRDTSSNL